jgi:hypothetical protein
LHRCDVTTEVLFEPAHFRSVKPRKIACEIPGHLIARLNFHIRADLELQCLVIDELCRSDVLYGDADRFV